jgi:L,D-transpeptidase catalytic domain
VRNHFLSIPVGLVCTAFTILPAEQRNSTASADAGVSITSIQNITKDNTADNIYNSIQLELYGLSKEAFEHAFKGYQYLLVNEKINVSTYLTICDFSQSSRNKRLYIIDLDNNELVTNTYVAHGKNSGAEYATRFSNTPESLQSSLGFYITSATYTGKHGLSLRMNGVDPGFNDKALERTIVIHGAAYVDPTRAAAGLYMGRSWGCPAVPQKESAQIINTIKNGSCLFIYHPSRNYLQNSKILND